MKTELKILLKSLYAGEITNREFLGSYFDNEIPSADYLENLLTRAIDLNSSDIVEEAVVLLYTKTFNIEDVVQLLCELIKEPWHTKHEDIVMLLADVKDPKTVDCIYEAAILKFEYLNYDETYQLARKCIKVLSGIGDKNSIEKLKLLSAYKVPLIANYAKKELLRKDL